MRLRSYTNNHSSSSSPCSAAPLLLLLLLAISCCCCWHCCCPGSPLQLPLMPTSGPSVLHRHHHAAHVPLHAHRHDVKGAVRVSIAAVVARRVRAEEGVAAAQRVSKLQTAVAVDG